MDYQTTHTSLSPIRPGFVPGLVNYKKVCTRFAGANDKAYQLLVHGRWFSPGTPASFTSKTARQDIDELLLKVAFNTINQIHFLLALYSGADLGFQVRGGAHLRKLRRAEGGAKIIGVFRPPPSWIRS